MEVLEAVSWTGFIGGGMEVKVAKSLCLEAESARFDR